MKIIITRNISYLTLSSIMLASCSSKTAALAFTRASRSKVTSITSRTLFQGTTALYAKPGQAETILVGCGAPNRGMGWYHAIQMLEGRCPSASLDYVIEPWFLGGGAEGPGGPEFKEWKEEAEVKGVEVLMGYNKNVCKYVRNTREYAAANPGSHVTFVSNNAYENTAESLGECFERNAEGMLKNMAIHELALLVSFYDVSVDNIDSVTADKEFSSMQTLKGPSGKEWTDFDKIKFTIKTKTGNEVSVAADRCGGTDSYATVTGEGGDELFRYYMPDEEDKKLVDALTAKYPTAMPYFFTQDPDYITVKERVAKHTVDGEPAEGIATIGIAVETLKVAEYLTPILQEQLK
jgi:hypothetical protein